jgi:hypothetical protein
VHRCLCLCAVAILTLPSSPTRAEGIPTLPDYGLAVGPSIAWSRVFGSDRAMVAVDITGHVVMLWGSLGVRAAANGPRFVAPYAEVGAWLFANLGIGYSLAFMQHGSAHLIHGFVGVPLPVTFNQLRSLLHLAMGSHASDRNSLVIEPYYRPSLRLAGAACPFINEAGLLLKIWTY